MSDPAASIPRGRHAPPLEIRLQRQRARLFSAAAAVFARHGFAEAGAEAISREAGMSKATFYEHFANKEECILALFDAAAEQVETALGAAVAGGATPEQRIRQGVRTFLGAVAAFPNQARTLLVEIIGAGPRASARRDAALERFAAVVVEQNRLGHEELGDPRFASRDDVYALIGAIAELVSRQLRTGRPEDPLDLEPVIERLATGLLRVGPDGA